MGEPTGFKIATLNVHGWTDATFENNVERVAKIIKTHQPDVICFQESREFGCLANFRLLMPDYAFSFNANSCVIMSKFKMTEMYSRSTRSREGKFLRFVTGHIQVPGSDFPVYLTCLHLDYRTEPVRLGEISVIRQITDELFSKAEGQIWTGDFNALTKEDYSPEVWQEVANVRKRNSWESPKTDLTQKVKSYGFIDCWERVGRPNPVQTCRFDTRIDYIYANKPILDHFLLQSVHHVIDTASDHNLVIAKFDILK